LVRVGGGVGVPVGAEVVVKGGVPILHWDPEQPFPGSGEPAQVHWDYARKIKLDLD
jgi:hypothetical protein